MLVGDALIHVAVAGEQQRLPACCCLELGVGAEQVVGFELGRILDVPAERSEQVRRLAPLPGQVLRHRRTLRVVARVQLDAVRRLLGPEADHDRARRDLGGDPQQQIGRAEQRVDRMPVGAADRIGQREERPVQHERGVDYQQWTGHCPNPNRR